MATLARRENFQLLHPREFSSYFNARQRCYNPKNVSYTNYGERGITFCFNSFREFYAHMGDRPDNTTLERLDNNGNYAPGNVVWATKKVQARNRRNNVYLTLDGKTQCVSAWAEQQGLSQRTLAIRLQRGWSVERALTTPVRKRVLSPS